MQISHTVYFLVTLIFIIVTITTTNATITTIFTRHGIPCISQKMTVSFKSTANNYLQPASLDQQS